MQHAFPNPSLRLALAGAGALGSAVCRRLMLRGVQRVLVVDPDRVEPHNLRLSESFSHADIGRHKAEVIAAAARARGLAWEAAHVEIADVALGVLRDCDALASATDSALSRVETAFAARALRLPMLDAGVMPDGLPEGRVSWFAPSADAACALCGLGQPRRAELLGEALSASLGCRLPEAAAPMSGADAAVKNTVEATAEALLALLGETLPARPPASFARRLRLGAAGVEAEEVALPRSPSCPWHTPALADELRELAHDEPMRAQVAPDQVLEFAWPICTLARCRACCTVCHPMQRTAAVRRRLACPGCGAFGVLEPLSSIARLRAEDALLKKTPHELGLPARQMGYVRQRVRVPDVNAAT